MEATKPNNGGSALAIHGKNFHGEIQLKGNILRLDIVDFKKGGFYIIQITNQLMEKEHKRFLIFKKVEDLYSQLIENTNLEVSDQNSLIFSIDVPFKQQHFQLKIQIPLEQRKFNNQFDRLQILYQQFDNINKLNIEQKSQLNLLKKQVNPQLIRFICDKNNPNYKSFEVIGEAPRIRFVGQNLHTPLTHERPLPTAGIFQFKVKYVKLLSKNIFLGICGKGIRYKTDGSFYSSPFFIGIYTGNGYLQVFGKTTRQVTPPITIAQGNVMTIEVDMSRRLISFYLDNVSQCFATFWPEMHNIEMYPVVSSYTNGDTIEFVNE